MIAPRFIPVILKQLARHRVRTALTLAGVGVAMFLFITVQALQSGVRRATQAAADDTLVVYRENRFCPPPARLPEWYAERIRKVPGVASAIPIKIVVNNCRASLDVVTFRGIPESSLAGSHLSPTSGPSLKAPSTTGHTAQTPPSSARPSPSAAASAPANPSTPPASPLPSPPSSAARAPGPERRLRPPGLSPAGRGQRRRPRLRDAVHRPRLRPLAPRPRRRRDRRPLPRRGRPHLHPPRKGFVAQAGADIVELVRFTRWLGWGCLAAVLALVANAIVLGVQDRIKEHAVLQTLGYRSGLIARLIVSEGLVIGLVGGAVGAGISLAVVRFGNFSLSQEGLSIPISADPAVFAWGLLISAGVGIAAGLAPRGARPPRDRHLLPAV